MEVAVGADHSCDGPSTACSLEAAVAWATSQAGMVVELTLQEGDYELDAPLHFDDSSAAAEVVLSAAEGAEVVLRPTAKRAAC